MRVLDQNDASVIRVVNQTPSPTSFSLVVSGQYGDGKNTTTFGCKLVHPSVWLPLTRIKDGRLSRKANGMLQAYIAKDSNAGNMPCV